MKKVFEQPKAELMQFATEDIMTLSAGVIQGGTTPNDTAMDRL